MQKYKYFITGLIYFCWLSGVFCQYENINQFGYLHNYRVFSQVLPANVGIGESFEVFQNLDPKHLHYKLKRINKKDFEYTEYYTRDGYMSSRNELPLKVKKTGVFRTSNVVFNDTIIHFNPATYEEIHFPHNDTLLLPVGKWDYFDYKNTFRIEGTFNNNTPVGEWIIKYNHSGKESSLSFGAEYRTKMSN